MDSLYGFPIFIEKYVYLFYSDYWYHYFWVSEGDPMSREVDIYTLADKILFVKKMLSGYVFLILNVRFPLSAHVLIF